MEVLINWVNPAPTMGTMVRPSLGDLAPTNYTGTMVNKYPQVFQGCFYLSIYLSKTLELKPSCKVSQTGDTGASVLLQTGGGKPIKSG
jgi:hypothetical protein